MRNRMYFGDLLITREIKALDSAWEDFVFYAYKPVFNFAGEDGESPEDDRKRLQDTIDWIESARVLYLEERARLKGKFGKREKESEIEEICVKDDESFRVSKGGSRWPKEVGEELFGKKCEEVNVKGLGKFSDPLIVDDLVGEALPETTDENRDVVKEARGFIFNEHPGVKEKVSDGLEEFLRRTLKEDE